MCEQGLGNKKYLRKKKVDGWNVENGQQITKLKDRYREYIICGDFSQETVPEWTIILADSWSSFTVRYVWVMNSH